MAGSLAVLARRRKEIDKEIKILNKEMAEIDKVLVAAEDMAAKLTQVVDVAPKKGGGPSSQRARGGAKPVQVVAATKQILSRATTPMTRGELLSQLKSMGIQIVGANPANTLGTTLSRHKDVFRNVDGFGYWLVERPYNPAPLNKDDDAENGAGAIH